MTFVAGAVLAACTSPARPDVPDVALIGPRDASEIYTPDAADVITSDVRTGDASGDAGPDASAAETFCELGTDVPGAVLPPGFCMRSFASNPPASRIRMITPRVLAFAPNGDLFVSSPGTTTPGGAPSGVGAILVFTDDDHDGIADTHVFRNGVSDVHGLAFARGYLFFTTGDAVWRIPYSPGDRTAMRPSEMVAPFVAGSVLPRWTHGLAFSTDGTLYATQGNYGSNVCPPSEHDGSINEVHEPFGPIGSASMTTVAQGFRNPMYARCHPSSPTCLAAELNDDTDSYNPDFPATAPAPEKILVVRRGTTYGYPCCVTGSDSSVNNVAGGRFNCSAMTTAESDIPLHDTPFGLDWERGLWPAEFRGAVFVALHGSAYSTPNWAGARIQFAVTSPITHAPSGAWTDFITGWGRSAPVLRRPTDIAFAPDGRMFIADDEGGRVFWVAPTGLRRTRR